MPASEESAAAGRDAGFALQARQIVPTRVMFSYWGRRGLSRFALLVARAALSSPKVQATFSVSRQNDRFADFAELADALVPVDTFNSSAGALLWAHRISAIRRTLLRHVTDHRPQAVIELMPHVWSPFVMPSLKAAGVRYVTVAHDAAVHPGDYRSAAAIRLLQRTIRQADLVLTLSRHVATEIRNAGLVPHDRTVSLFHPHLPSDDCGTRAPPRADEPWRLLFLGRILPYKGLSLFVGAVEELRRRGFAVHAGVFGEGALDAHAHRLAALGAEVVNRWLTDEEIDAVLQRYHAVVVSHIEASQSGVVALAFGAGAPVVATPVGGLLEQVEDGVTGVLASAVGVTALSEAVARLMTNADLYLEVSRNLAEMKEKTSIAKFVEQCVHHALPDRDVQP